MITRLKKEIEDNERAVFATLCCVAVLVLQIVYEQRYSYAPSPIVLMMPILLWMLYHGNRHEPATMKGYWLWIIFLIILTTMFIIYPLF